MGGAAGARAHRQCHNGAHIRTVSAAAILAILRRTHSGGTAAGSGDDM